MNSDQLLKIVEQYSRKSEAGYGDIKVTRVARSENGVRGTSGWCWTGGHDGQVPGGWSNILGRIQFAQ